LMRFTPERPSFAPNAPTPTVRSTAAGMELTFTRAFDRDDQLLTYEILREGQEEPIATLVKSGVPWTVQQFRFVDSAPGAPGTSVRYRIRVSDAETTRTSAYSASATVPAL
jgi:hypothetical protein